MKKIPLLTAAAFMALSFISCNPDDDNTPTPAPTPNPTPTAGFVWKEDGGTAITADSAYWTTGAWGTGIRAYKGGMSQFFEINWDTQDNTSVGAKALPAQGGITYIANSITYTNKYAASLHVTAFANDKLSGNFNVGISSPGASGTVDSVSATFTELPKR